MLQGSAALVGLYALALVLAGPTASRLFDVLGFGPRSGQVPAGAAREHVLLIYGVLGSVIVGWMLLVAGLAGGPLRRGDRQVWRVVVVAVTVWFVLDTTFSLAVGSWPHAVFNAAFLAALGVPLAGWRLAARDHPLVDAGT